MKHGTETEIQFSGLKSGIYDYHFTLDDGFFSEYKNEKILHGKVDYSVRLDKKERLMMFHFDFGGTIGTQCDRCLAELDVPVEGSNDLCVKFSDTETSDDEDVVFLPTNESHIDLAQWMYEYVAVALPMRCVHPNNDDGTPMCDATMMSYLKSMQTDGSNTDTERAIDPRWSVLEKLK